MAARLQDNAEQATAVLRAASLWQVLGVYRVHRACFPLYYPFWRFVAYQLTPLAAIRVALVDDEVVAYVVVVQTEHGAPPQRAGEIVSLGVSPDWRRRGLGARLLRQALRQVADWGLAETLLQVAVDNSAAQTLYAQAGFERRERLPRYYLNGDDAWLMSRTG